MGIDIVSEDQKTIVHHKVAAKVEHAGFLNPSSNLLDMNFGDLDPANGGMMMQPQGGVPFRGRNGGQAPMAANGRMPNAGGMMGPQANVMTQQRGFFFSPISTEQIVKRLQVGRPVINPPGGSTSNQRCRMKCAQLVSSLKTLDGPANL